MGGKKNLTLFILLVGALNIQCYEIHVRDPLKLQQGICWPHTLRVAVGNEMLLKLTRGLNNMQSCTVTSPDGQVIDVSTPNDRYEPWSEICGVKVKTVNKNDEGRWRLEISNGTNTLIGWSEVHIQTPTTSYEAPPTTLIDGEAQTDVEITTLDTTYCIVTQPFRDGSLIPGHCEVKLDKATRAVQGNWWVLMGLPGQVEELRIGKQVNVEAERLDVGYIYDSNLNKIHLFCNMLHTTKNITFCRFQQTTSVVGFNVIDGLSDGNHSYYGEGFARKQCGITIENPSDKDYGSWRCSVGLQQWVGNNIVQQTPMQALITFSKSSKANRQILEDENTKTVFSQLGMPITLTCKADESLRYCWFQHPNGTQLTPTELSSEDQDFWHAGDSLQTGNCAIHLPSITEEDAGEWICHMGPRERFGVEITDVFNVRVSGPLAANKQELKVSIGDPGTIFCHTSNGNFPLDYCRFLSPSNVGFSLDDSVTEEKPILERFFFTPGKSLVHGDCSLNIKEVTEKDLGEWTCAGLVNKDVVEARDKVLLIASSTSSNLSQAGIIGMAIGLSVLVIALSGLLVYKYGKRLPNPWQNTGIRPVSPASDMIDLGPRPVDDNTSVSSCSSGEMYTRR